MKTLSLGSPLMMRMKILQIFKQKNKFSWQDYGGSLMSKKLIVRCYVCKLWIPLVRPWCQAGPINQLCKEGKPPAEYYVGTRETALWYWKYILPISYRSVSSQTQRMKVEMCHDCFCKRLSKKKGLLPPTHTGKNHSADLQSLHSILLSINHRLEPPAWNTSISYIRS